MSALSPGTEFGVDVYDHFNRYGFAVRGAGVFHLVQQGYPDGRVQAASFCGATVRFTHEIIRKPEGRLCRKCERLWERAA